MKHFIRSFVIYSLFFFVGCVSDEDLLVQTAQQVVQAMEQPVVIPYPAFITVWGQ